MAAVVVTLQRDKCIGCGYCTDVAGEYFSMDPSDGKCLLRGAAMKKGFYTLRCTDPLAETPCRSAQESCPAGAIRVAAGGGRSE
ncbi:MAG TPA: ferredoxin [Candidatus Merdimorpha stercoravium]|uniref:Ferredoxin n=1 Tax=Candidatus Merdimorpha stercoravium TaxID=2840863 RepID=A0A9D1KU29_9FLAO|nr:ferredoxin [Candidatus Merdimorpha stercoravium]